MIFYSLRTHVCYPSRVKFISDVFEGYPVVVN